MLSRTPVVYRIDDEDRVVEVNDGWLAFAEANQGEALHPSVVVGRSLWDFLSDRPTIDLYRVMVKRLRGGSSRIRFRLRCDSPDRRRLLTVEMTGDDKGGVLFNVTPIFEETRPWVALLGQPAHLRGAGLLTVCGWCMRAEMASGAWVEIEEAAQALGLSEGEPMPRLRQGVCTTCREAITRALNEPTAGGARAQGVAVDAQDASFQNEDTLFASFSIT